MVDGLSLQKQVRQLNASKEDEIFEGRQSINGRNRTFGIKEGGGPKIKIKHSLVYDTHNYNNKGELNQTKSSTFNRTNMSQIINKQGTT